MEQKKLNNIIKAITVLATAFLVILVGIIAFQRITYSKYDKKVIKIDEQIELLQKQRANIENDIEKRSSSVYLEELARSELLIQDDETYFEISEE